MKQTGQMLFFLPSIRENRGKAKQTTLLMLTKKMRQDQEQNLHLLLHLDQLSFGLYLLLESSLVQRLFMTVDQTSGLSLGEFVTRSKGSKSPTVASGLKLDQTCISLSMSI